MVVFLCLCIVVEVSFVKSVFMDFRLPVAV
jgi:hypothetical protein